MNVRTLGILALVSTVSGGGCAHLSLKDKVVREIRMQPLDAGVCAGEETKIAVAAVLGDGTEVVTTGAGHGKVGWNNYTTTLSPGTAKDGKIQLSSDPRETWNKPATFLVTATDHPGVQWTGAIAVRYDCTVQAKFAGRGGDGGPTGNYGGDGDSPGGDGGDGGDGSAADRGHDGHDVEAWVTTVVGPGQTTLVQAAIQSEGERSYYAFDALRGSLTIDASGGKGGTGGYGGTGGDGGKASADVKAGRGGNGGNGYCGSDGGDGGDVLLHFDPRAGAYLNRIVIQNPGGDGGDGGDGGAGGYGSRRGHGGEGGCPGDSGHDGRQNTVTETVAPLW
jgi:hypothetical protein